jgi:hypothetical protein
VIPLLAAALLGSAATVTPGPEREAYRIDGKTSRLTVETETTGLSSMFGPRSPVRRP